MDGKWCEEWYFPRGEAVLHGMATDTYLARKCGNAV